MSELQYFHDQNSKTRRTYCVECSEDLQWSLQNCLMDLVSGIQISFIDIKIGYATVHYADKYVKSIGRALAQERLTIKRFHFHSFVTENNEKDGVTKHSMFIWLRSGNCYLQFKFNPNAPIPYLFYVEIRE